MFSGVGGEIRQLPTAIKTPVLQFREPIPLSAISLRVQRTVMTSPLPTGWRVLFDFVEKQ